MRHSILLEDGRRYNCKITDICFQAPPSRSTCARRWHPVTLGRMRARVVRHFQDGIAVEFASVQEMLTVVQQNLSMN